ncbi:MAG: hypothetical protein HOC79_00075 [Euryarchaeota archaeon]|jgi:hypothetical protein|nr:hypothetical protein [Euryarchaeota archaeon]
MAITHRGITYTANAGTEAMVLDLPLIGGVDQDDTAWLTSYPGALTSFAARQSDGTNSLGPRLVLLTWTGATAGATLTLSGGVTAIHGAFSEIGSAGDSGISKSGLVLTHNSSATETLTMLLILG